MKISDILSILRSQKKNRTLNSKGTIGAEHNEIESRHNLELIKGKTNIRNIKGIPVQNLNICMPIDWKKYIKESKFLIKQNKTNPQSKPIREQKL